MSPSVKVYLSQGRVKEAVFNFEDREKNAYANLSELYRYCLGVLKQGVSHRKFYMYGGVLFRVNGKSYYSRGCNRKLVSGFDPSRKCAEMEALDNMEEFLDKLAEELDVSPKELQVRVDLILNFGDIQADDLTGEEFHEGTCNCGHCRREFLVHPHIDTLETVTASTILPNARSGHEVPRDVFYSTPKQNAERWGTLPKQGAWRS